MAITKVNAYATDSSNQSATSPTPVSVIYDGTGDEQIMVIGDGTGSTAGIASSKLNVNSYITDGTDVADVIVGDTGFNSLAASSGTKTISFTTTGTGAQTIGPFDVRGYQTIEVVWTAVGTGLTLTGGQWSPASGGTFQTASTWTTGINAPSNALGVTVNTFYKSQIWGNYFQIAVSALTSGTATGYITLRNMPLSSATISATTTAAASTNAATPTTAQPVGFKALSADQTATTTGYNTQGIVDLVGKQVVMPYAINQLFVKGSGNTTGTGSTALISAGAAGICNYITSISVMNTGTTTTVVNILDGASTMYQVGAPAGGGATISLPVPLKGSAATAVNFNAVNASSTIYVSVAGYTGV